MSHISGRAGWWKPPSPVLVRASGEQSPGATRHLGDERNAVFFNLRCDTLLTPRFSERFLKSCSVLSSAFRPCWGRPRKWEPGLARLNERYQVRIRNTICPKIGVLKQRGTLDHEARAVDLPAAEVGE